MEQANLYDPADPALQDMWSALSTELAQIEATHPDDPPIDPGP